MSNQIGFKITTLNKFGEMEDNIKNFSKEFLGSSMGKNRNF